MNQPIKLILGGAIFCLPMLFTSCGNIDNPLEEIIASTGSGESEGGTSESSENKYLVWNTTTGKLELKDLPTSYKEMTSTETAWSGTYIVNKDIEIEDDITLAGDVDLIILDGKTLSLASNKKIDANATTYTLNIYSQSTDDSAGKLVISTTGNDTYYPIWTGGTINIHGASVSTTASGLNNYGISAKNLNIYGAKVVSNSLGFGLFVKDVLNIYGDAIVESEGRFGGIYTTDGGTNGSLYIYGGNVTAKGSDGSGGIAISVTKAFEVSGGTLIANGGSGGSGGTGIYADCTLLINGGSVTATGGNAGTGNCNGGKGVDGNVNVTSGSLFATGKAGNGTGTNGQGVTGTISFTGLTGKACDDGSSWDTDLTSGDTSTKYYVKVTQ
jgi:hypothetical protein